MALQRLAGLIKALNDSLAYDTRELALVLVDVLREGLEGNRVVQAGDVWGVVAATARAYPLQLGPSVERAQAALGATPTRPLAELWVLQAAADGALAPLVAALRKQPQILTAYTKAAPLRDPALSAQLETLVSQLQGKVTSPFEQLRRQQAQPESIHALPEAAPAIAVTAHIQTEEDARRPKRRMGARKAGASDKPPAPPQQQGVGGASVGGSTGGRKSGAGLAVTPQACGRKDRVRLQRSGSSGNSRGSRGSRGGSGRARGRGSPRAVTATIVVLPGGQGASGASAAGGGRVVELRLVVKEQRQSLGQQGSRLAAAAASAAAARVTSTLQSALAVVGVGAVPGAGSDAAAGGEGAAAGAAEHASAVPSPAKVLGMIQTLKQSAEARTQELGGTLEAALAQPLAAVKSGWSFLGRHQQQQAAGSAAGAGTPAPPATPTGSVPATASDAGGGPSRGSGSGTWLPSPSALLSMARTGILQRSVTDDGGGTRPAEQAAHVDAGGGKGAGAGPHVGEGAAEVAARAAAAAGDAAAAAEAAASSGKGLLGDGSPYVLALVDAMAEVVAHGLRQPQARGLLAGWMKPRKKRPFSTLLAVEKSGQRRLRPRLGARTIVRIRAARSAGDSARLQLWVRDSLNQQQLGSRLVTLCGSAAALRAHYEPWALLLQAPWLDAPAASPARRREQQRRQRKPRRGQQPQGEEPPAQVQGGGGGDGEQQALLQQQHMGQAAGSAASQQLLILLDALRALDAHRFALAVHPDACRVAVNASMDAGDDAGSSSSAMLSPLSSSDDMSGPEWWTADAALWREGARAAGGEGGAAAPSGDA